MILLVNTGDARARYWAGRRMSTSVADYHVAEWGRKRPMVFSVGIAKIKEVLTNILTTGVCL
jgi:hypothetical protein